MQTVKNLQETWKVRISIHPKMIYYISSLLIYINNPSVLLIKYKSSIHLLSRLCGPKGYQECPADSLRDADSRPAWIDGFNTGFEYQGFSQGVTSTTPAPDNN